MLSTDGVCCGLSRLHVTMCVTLNSSWPAVLNVSKRSQMMRSFLSPVTTGDIYGRIFPKKQGRKPTESKYKNVYGSRNILHVILTKRETSNVLPTGTDY